MTGVSTEKEYSIHYYEVDYKRRALITSLMNYFDDIAMQQSEDLQCGIDFLNEKKLAWVLYKWDIHINKYPVYNDKVKVETLAYGMKKVYAYRKFYIKDKNNENIVEAESDWFIINSEQRKLIKIPDFMYDVYKIPKDCKDTLNISKIKKIERTDTEKKFNVRYDDIDTNRHVNNVKYVAWAIETVPQDIVLKYELKNLKVNYIKETSYGEKVSIRTQINKDENKIVCLHEIQNKEDKTLALLETVWG